MLSHKFTSRHLALRSIAVQTLKLAATTNALPHRIIRLREVESRTGFKRSHIYNLMKEGRFPKAVKLGIRAVGWDASAVDSWISGRIHGTAPALSISNW